MNDIREVIRAFAAYVVECNQWSKAEQYFVYLEKDEASWRPPFVLVRELMRHAASVDHAAGISHFLAECLSKKTPTWVIRSLHAEEREMYLRLRSTWGVRKCLVRDISESPEGRAFLRSQWKEAK